MKLLTTICLLFILVNEAYSQEPDKGLVEVRYSFIHIQDTTKRNAPYTENMFLVAGKNASRYASFDRVIKTVKISQIRADIVRVMQPDAATQMAMRSKYQAVNSTPSSESEYFYYAGSHKLFSVESFRGGGYPYFVEEPDAGPVWKISKDTLNFSGIHCQKALTTFKGRNWIAWFATELPFESGPWKLSGLPGLIIEAYDDKNEVQFRFAGLQQIKDGDLAIPVKDLPAELVAELNNPGSYSGDFHLFNLSEITVPARLNRATRKEFDKAKEASAGMVRVVGGGGSGGGYVGAGGGNMAAPAPPPGTPVAAPVIPVNIINNPIELSATK